ncbi:MAG: TonB-dependent receptor [Bacteroidales bacterium]|nr:TonB-dependent receptor [Bacteroidales bacterium]
MKSIRSFCFTSGLLALYFFNAVCADSTKVYYLDEVSVVQSRNIIFSEDKRIIEVDSSIFEIYKNVNLGQLLSVSAPITIRQYGAEGGISMAAVRGLRVNHTQVNWNGIPINSLTTGDNDLSLIPSGIIDRIQLNFGASGSLYGSGTIGTSIGLTNEPDWKNKLNINFCYERGSFISNKYKAAMRIGNENFQYHIGAIHYTAANNFIYNDYYLPGNPEVRMEDNAYSNSGIMQHFFFRLPKRNSIQVGIWYQDKNYEPPNTMGRYYRNYAYQNDNTFKTYLSWVKVYKSSSLTVKSAYFDDYLRYRYKQNVADEDYAIDSKYDTRRVYNNLNFRKYIKNTITIDIGSELQLAQADVSNYRGNRDETRFAVMGAAKYKWKNTIFNTSLREEFVDDRTPHTLYSFGIHRSLNSIHEFKANISNKYRTPTFNERFWQPGGNPDLEPEQGWSTEVSYLNNFHRGNHHIRSSHTLYYARIENLVQWITDSIIHPVPEKNARTLGYEFTTNYQFSVGRFLIKSNLNYIFSNAIITGHYEQAEFKGNKLIYAPAHTLSGFINASFKRIYGGITSSLISKQYTTEDNQEILSLPAYSVTNLHMGTSWRLLGTSTTLQFRIINLFNTSYEVVKAYAMPGRAFYISVSIGLNKI